MSLIPARSHTLAKIDHEIISTAILLSTANSRRDVVSYKRKYVHEVLVNCLDKLSQACSGKSVVRLKYRADMTIAVDWDVKTKTKINKTKTIKKTYHLVWTATFFYEDFKGCVCLVIGGSM